MRRLLTVGLVLAGLSGVGLAQELRWLPGLDVIVPLESKEGVPTVWLGWDRDTGRGSRLAVADGCYTAWVWRPTAGEGAVTHLLVLGPRQVALYHDSGFVRVEPVPDAHVCVPVGRQ